METAIQILLLIVLTPIALIILALILNSFADSHWEARNRKYREQEMEQRRKEQ